MRTLTLLTLGLVATGCLPPDPGGRDDGGPGLDAGTMLDAGRPDAGVDAGVDAGAPTDAGTPADAGAPEDAGIRLAGAARAECAPNGGPAWRFVLTDQPRGCDAFNDAEGYFASLWVADLRVGPYMVGPTPPAEGSACLCGVLADEAVQGTLTIDTFSDAGITGRLDAQFRTGTTRRDAFDVVVCPALRPCR